MGPTRRHSKLPHVSAASYIPEADRWIISPIPGGQQPAIRGEDDRKHPALMAVEPSEFLAGRDLPQANGLVQSAGGQRLAVGREGNGINGVLGMPRKHADCLPRRRIPEADRFARGGNRSSVGRKGDGEHDVIMSDALMELSAGSYIPNADRVILAGRGQGPAVGREGDGRDRALVPFEPAALLTGRQVPQADGVVPTPGGEGPTIRRKSDGIHSALMPADRMQFSARGPLPQPDCVSVGNGQGSPVRGKCQGADAAEVPFERTQLLARGRVPQSYRGPRAARGERLPVGRKGKR